MAEKVKSGEKRQSGWLYFVKGNNLEIWKAKMARGGKKKSRSAAKKSKSRRR
ncbi:hypothetical protein J4471_05890 [Candidatus Woesearchaeota archaeon]|nr:hypothetical protein [Candidatus Woesearchaeota archaeon]